jgi:hypothetical protein
MSNSTSSMRPDALFVVACPGCHGAIAATAALAGAAACCPLCAAAFVVPVPEPPAAPVPAAEPPSARPAAAERSAPIVAPVTDAGPSGPVDWTETPDSNLSDGLVSQPEPQPEPDREMTFREPVRTVGSGANVIELRRLSPEEKDARRRRRNILMLLTGGAILVLFVLLFNTRRRKR